ncbi:MAG: DUF5123 domain-containing protein [Verrucomicrobia bacterium]|nr:DUF5123 domain-containing protein [Verrucomicrobiota bacterium]MBU4291497.1 DUF5123 domain-containing protein [Verrucomicrobiota bacterium]MBU4428771.1 DUF5123 domain-containing protein [Verrucomicrobiota bacterium]MBU4496807.1 DUF5123 domain-containing protein [Verrucomicrobiota bacterium]MCG2680726.1 DUF5123 domain-containing protein [Kiritimatiellia bacterium]
MSQSGMVVDAWKRADTDWFRDCKWGVFTHYLVKPETTVDGWNRQVDSFDTKRRADPLFVNPEKGDFSLKPDSPALKLGFKPLDLDWLRKKEAVQPRR